MQHDKGAPTRRQLLYGLGAISLGGFLASPEPSAFAGVSAHDRERLLYRARWGAYAAGEPWEGGAAHRALETKLGTRIPIMSWFMTWSVAWPKGGGAAARAGKYDLLIAWQPELDDDTPISFRDILDGRHDAYIRRFFTAAGEHPGKVVVRFAHEMNGKGYPWSMGFTGIGPKCISSPDEYIAGWRYIAAAGKRIAPNVSLMWCISTSDKGDVPAESYYPGNDVVDQLGMDVYNGYGGRWSEPKAAFGKTYDRLMSLRRSQEIWAAEVGCREPSKLEPGAPIDPDHKKSDWLRKLFDIEGMPNLTTLCFFNQNKTFDWRLDSTREALAVSRDAFRRRALVKGAM